MSSDCISIDGGPGSWSGRSGIRYSSSGVRRRSGGSDAAPSGSRPSKLQAPLTGLGVSLLLEPRETFLLWIVGRWSGRRDWLMLSVTLTGVVKGAFEVYHPKRRGAMDSAREVRELGWQTAPLPGRPELLCAAPGPDGRALGAGGPERASRGGRVARARPEQGAAAHDQPSDSGDRDPGAPAGFPVGPPACQPSFSPAEWRTQSKRRNAR